MRQVFNNYGSYYGDDFPELPQTFMEHILEQVKKDHVQFVQLQFTDLLGVIKSLTIPVGQLEDSLTHGTWFDGSSIEGFTRIHESDMFLKPMWIRMLSSPG